MKLAAVPIVLSPWLPTPWLPYAGSFVLDFARYARLIYQDDPRLIHLDDSYRSETAVSVWLARRIVGHESRRLGHLKAMRMRHVPIPVPPGSGWVQRAQAARQVCSGLDRSLSRVASSQIDIHAHVGIMSGSAVSGWKRPRHRLFVYEHASFIVPLLQRDLQARQIYGATITAAHTVFCVNPTMTAEMREIYPAQADKFRFHPNAIDFQRFPFRLRKPPLRKWLYIGNLKPSKGSRRLIYAFKEASRHWDDMSLTLVGSGADEGWLSEQDIPGRIRRLPPVAPSAVPALMADADLLVHLSEGETFGITALEAVASGMPVLLTSTDGSELTIRPIVEKVGAIVPQKASPGDVAEAFGELRSVPPRLDLEFGRKHLEGSFGHKSVAAQLAGWIAA